MTDRETHDPEAFLPLAPRDFQVLMILLRAPLHAYGLSLAAEQERRGAVRLEIGSLYRMLARMLSTGLIEEVEDAGERGEHARGTKAQRNTMARRGATARRSYRTTALGRRVAEAEAARLAEVVEAARAASLLPDTTG